MPSQEDYLDQLLNGISEEEAQEALDALEATGELDLAGVLPGTDLPETGQSEALEPDLPETGQPEALEPELLGIGPLESGGLEVGTSEEGQLGIEPDLSDLLAGEQPEVSEQPEMPKPEPEQAEMPDLEPDLSDLLAEEQPEMSEPEPEQAEVPDLEPNLSDLLTGEQVEMPEPEPEQAEMPDLEPDLSDLLAGEQVEMPESEPEQSEVPDLEPNLSDLLAGEQPEVSEPEPEQPEMPEPEPAEQELLGIELPEIEPSELELSETGAAGIELPEIEPSELELSVPDATEDPIDLGALSMDEPEDDADVSMTEEEIEKLLQESRMEESQAGAAEEAMEQEDLMELLQGADDSDLQDIHDLLQKADNNEAVDEAMIAKMQEVPDMRDEAAQEDSTDIAADAEDAILSLRQQKALEKKKQKKDKADAKKAAKEAKKAAKLAKKNAKKAGVPITVDGGNVQVEGAGTGASQADPGAEAVSQETDMDEDNGIDMAELDELLNFSVGASGENTADKADAAENNGMEVVDIAAGEVADLPEKSVADENGGQTEEKGKKGFFARILEFLTEEDEEDEEESGRGTEDIPLSDENKNILKEMDQEEPGKKGKKGKKPKKEKKGKKGKGEPEAGGEDAEGSGDKKKKPKKEKKPKEETPVNPKHKITVKKVMPVALVCLSVLVIVLLLIYLGGDFVLKREARKAFYKEDYATCYQELYGKKLNESEQVMFGKSESILRVRLWMREYELYAQEGEDAQALDILIQSVNDYARLYEYANQWNAGAEVGAVYTQMLEILQNKYGLTEAQALAIAAEPDDVEYTKQVMAVVDGQGMESQPFVPVELPDMLPEEKLFPENNGGQ